MAVADGKHELVAQNLVIALEQIGQDQSIYHHAPGTVFRVRFYDRSFWSDENPLTIMLRGATALWRREMNCEWEVEREFYVMASVREDDSERLPWLAAPGDGGAAPTTVQNRLVDDVSLALLSDESLGGVADSLSIEAVEYGYFVEGWTSVEVTARVIYRVPRTP